MCHTERFYIGYDTDNMELVLDFRQNNKSDWTSIGGRVISIPYIVQNISGDGIIKRVEMIYDYTPRGFSAIISVQIKYDECLSDKKIPIFRCRILSRNHTLHISREERLPLEGEKTKWLV